MEIRGRRRRKRRRRRSVRIDQLLVEEIGAETTRDNGSQDTSP